MISKIITRNLILASFAVLFFPGILRADNVNTKALGPASKDVTLDSYKIGNQRLKLKAFLVDSPDGLNEKTIQTAVTKFRAVPGTNDWDWSVGYTSLGRNPMQALVLSWYNLDNKEVAWLAVRSLEDEKWEQMSSRTLAWQPFAKKNLLHQDHTNGALVATRISKTGGSKVAYAFSRTAMLIDLEDIAR